MVVLSPANLELGLELLVCRPLTELLEAPCTSAWPLDAGGTLGQVAEVSATPSCQSSCSIHGHFLLSNP